MAGGITYGNAKDILSLVVENGIASDDPRVLVRTNEATRAILDELIPVGTMLTVDVQATGTDGNEIFLPAELENAIDVEVLGAAVNGQTDITQGYYNVVNQFAFVDPSAAHDNPLVDLFLQADPSTPSILRRKYQYPGLTPNATVRVTGAKRFIPITSDNDYLIVQNILAIKDMIQAIERGENNDPQGYELFHKKSIDRLMAEVKKHQLDPRNSMRRRGDYEADMVNYGEGTFGWMRARLAFELPGGLTVGKSELTRVVEQAEMNLIDAGFFVGALEEYEATIDGETILAPREVATIVAIDLCGRNLDVKNIMFNYIQQGSSWCPCIPQLKDEGEIFNKQTGERRRQYGLVGSGATEGPPAVTRTIRFIGALRWVKKAPGDAMIIKNFEAMRLACTAIIDQKAERWNEAQANKQSAIAILDQELGKYMAGQSIVAPVRLHGGFHRHRLL